MLLSRRHFFVSVAALMAAVLPRSSRAKGPLLAPTKRRRVVIVGAGISGLYAADLAGRKGCDVTVLEASDRVGGKAFGKKLDGRFFDLGGQAFNSDMKRVTKLGKRLGLTPVSKPPQTHFYCNGDEVVTGDGMKIYDDATDLMAAKTAELAKQSLDPKMRATFAKTSVADWARGFLPAEAIPQLMSYFRAEWCEEPERVSLLHFLDYSRDFHSEEDDEMATRFEEGMAGLATGLARELGTAVKLSMPVKKIVREEKQIRVVTRGQEFVADDVIVAIPMPQLAKIGFEGGDFETLKKAAASYHGGAVHKIILHYEKPFWKDRAREGVFSAPSGLAIMENSDLAAGFYSIVAFVGGPAVHQKLERSVLLEKLALVLGPEAKHPVGVIDQEWVNTEFLPGGYCSNRPPHEDVSLVVPKSVGRIYLAGSEIAPEFPSYVEGALSSAQHAVHAMLSVPV